MSESSEPQPEQDAADTSAGEDTAITPAEDDDNPSRREQKYRTRLREVEAENTSLAEQVEVLQRAQIGALVADAGLKPDAVWKTSELATMLDPNTGAVDPQRVSAAVKFARQFLGIEVHAGLRVREGGNPARPSGNTFTNAFAPDRRSS